MAISEDVKNRFVEYIKLQGFDDQYIDRTEEKKILETAVKNGLSVEEGLSLLREVATQKGLVIERDVGEHAKEILARFAGNDGKVDKKEFADAVAIYKSACKGRVPEPEIQKRLKQMMLENGWKAKEGGLFGSKWFSAI
jgi:hypothetical protein